MLTFIGYIPGYQLGRVIRKSGLAIFFGLIHLSPALAQKFLPLNSAAQAHLDRLTILVPEIGGLIPAPNFPVWVSSELIKTIGSDSNFQDQKSRISWEHLRTEFGKSTTDRKVKLSGTRFEKLARPIYRRPENLFSFEAPNLKITVNPIVQFEVGKDFNDKKPVFFNRRGIEVIGEIDNSIGFSTRFIENQAKFADYVTDQVNTSTAVPNALFYKPYESRVFDSANSFDFNLAQATVYFRAKKHFGAVFGHGRNFIGHGHRSLFLSDFSGDYLYLMFSANFGKLDYRHFSMELSQNTFYQTRGLYPIVPKKFASVHYLTYKLARYSEIGIFEATSFKSDGRLRTRVIDPLPLSNAIREIAGTDDDVRLGLHFAQTFKKTARFYLQFLVDGARPSTFFSSDEQGYWGNRFGWQAGMFYVNAFGTKNLDLRIEHNSVRPYAYSGQNAQTSWSHYGQPLAHPLGANFQEFLGQATYRPNKKWGTNALLSYSKKGEDGPDENWGSDIFKSNDWQQRIFGNKTGQGIGATTIFFAATISYQFHHNWFVDANWMARNKVAGPDRLERSSSTVSVGIRGNFWPVLQNY